MRLENAVYHLEEDEVDDGVWDGDQSIWERNLCTFEYVWIRLSAAVHQTKSAPITKSTGQQLKES